ncbi:hypothetical protein [Nitrosomonas nitrosa]|uniref:hypothetical protein n=1 Tax=Nitrosomonas nitrosa TaxID=52442 RepID=UPI001EF9FA7F|nr:hypothetical protein [Nitrosomonas nitrosa]
MVEIQPHAIAMQIKNVVGAGAVNIRQTDALLTELVGMIEPRGIVHGNFGAKVAVAKVGPVADFTIADAYQIGQAIATHVGQIDGLRAIGEYQPGTLFFIQRLDDLPGGGEAVFRQGRMPGEHLMFADEYIGMAIAVQVDEF